MPWVITAKQMHYSSLNLKVISFFFIFPFSSTPRNRVYISVFWNWTAVNCSSDTNYRDPISELFHELFYHQKQLHLQFVHEAANCSKLLPKQRSTDLYFWSSEHCFRCSSSDPTDSDRPSVDCKAGKICYVNKRDSIISFGFLMNISYISTTD